MGASLSVRESELSCFSGGFFGHTAAYFSSTSGSGLEVSESDYADSNPLVGSSPG